MQSLTNNQIRTNFTVETEWDKGFTGRLDLTNMGEILADWTIEFESQFEITPEEIWGAEIVSRSGNIYTLKPVEYNQTIDAQESTSIIFNANKINGEILQPQKIGLSNIESDELEVTPDKDSDIVTTVTTVDPVVETVVEDLPTEISTNTAPTTEASDNLPAEVNFSLISDWGSSFQGSISITNNSESNIDSWSLEFDFPNQINNIWDAAIE